MPSPTLLLSLTMAAVLAAATVSDLRRRVIPNGLILFGTAVGLAQVLLFFPEQAGRHLAAAATGGLVLLGLRTLGTWIRARPALGMGDVKLVAVLGLFAGWDVLWVVYLGACLGAVVGLVGVLFGKWDRHAALPFAPFLSLGAWMSHSVLPSEAALAFFAFSPAS